MPPLPIDLHPAAVDEARAAREWYAERSAAAGTAFMTELDNAIDRIRESPDRWPADLHETRRYLLKRFPYLVIYRLIEDRIQVIAVAHGKRKPGYWRHRT
ncbi:MAG: type II toxin-antitoxin system RelE/ParE family toxin [Pirellulaceae bacterium]|jgi:plasmid stabilization system protein ParE|nr:type II toxin-antitoxin system RelE/ParE family toxin [Pirellulaceae bacterium]MDP7014258.1 type II toxin-antitoxin system RelE/ParE family toxin [Pirellulaceae bacterium]